jgi:hypothetical protein
MKGGFFPDSIFIFLILFAFIGWIRGQNLGSGSLELPQSPRNPRPRDTPIISPTKKKIKKR